MKRSTRLGTVLRTKVVGFLAGCLCIACGARTTIESSEPREGSAPRDAGADAVSDGPLDAPTYDQVNDINGCNPSTCGGCCDEKGACLTGLEADACGVGGFACADCTAFGASCDAGTHQCHAPEVCGPANCHGCCDPNGTCRDGADVAACGKAGGQCHVCSEPSYCDAASRTCMPLGADCGPSNCKGCCDPGGKCNWGGDGWACGAAGRACTDCTLSGATCDPHAMMCVIPADCGDWNCDGCCDAWGACQGGGDSQACGSAGSACKDCTLSGTTCDPHSLKCNTMQDCGPGNCAGCCTSSNPSVCVGGMSPIACGFGGQRCAQCPYPLACQATPMGGGTCSFVPPPADAGTGCGPWNCEGCCTSNGRCRSGMSNRRCGLGGVDCRNCAAQRLSCHNGTCR